MLVKLSTYLLGLIYIAAGVYHFVNPAFYTPLIPPYFESVVSASTINLLAGISEVLLGIGVLLPRYRNMSCYGIIAMLIAFIPSHWYMIQQGTFQLGFVEITPTIAWLRLLVVHPILMLWPWWIAQQKQ